MLALHRLRLRLGHQRPDAVAQGVTKKRGIGRAEGRLARFYGFNPFGLSEHEKLVLLANIDPVWAEEVLRNRQADLTAKGIYTLTKLATGDEGEAQSALADRVLADMARGIKPEV